MGFPQEQQVDRKAFKDTLKDHIRNKYDQSNPDRLIQTQSLHKTPNFHKIYFLVFFGCLFEVAVFFIPCQETLI